MPGRLPHRPQPHPAWSTLNPHAAVEALTTRLHTRLAGQQNLVRRLVLALLADGHVLLEGPPGLAKTRAVTALAACVEGTFHRVVLGPPQAAADLLGRLSAEPGPADRLGRAEGAIFSNILLAEGIDAATPDARSALLDIMSERQVELRGAVRHLPDVFMVVGTRTVGAAVEAVPLRPAELDRFLLHLEVPYPDASIEQEMLRLVRAEDTAQEASRPASADQPRLPLATLLAARAQVRAIRVGPSILRRITGLVSTTRKADRLRNELTRWVRAGVGPRGTIALERCARAHAWLAGRRQVAERDLAAVAHDVLRHRLQLAEGAEDAGVNADTVVDQLLALPVE